MGASRVFPSYDPIEKARLETLLDRAQKHATFVGEESWKRTLSIATELTQYYEKIALGSGATIAAMVSFIGTHSGKLNPPYLLRSSLVTLVMAMVAAMYRNWRYPKYVQVNYQVQQYKALLDRDKCKRDLFVAVPAIALQDGKPIDTVQFATQFSETETHMQKTINNFKKMERRIQKEVSVVGNGSLILALTGVGQLIALAWYNF